jgi:8-oxo-dGTP pyrophosphatase MutT (NUDIX family)
VSAASDVSWSSPAGTFNLRAAAIITRGDRVLLCTVDGLGYWFLPGGRVRLGEPSDAALARELAEELGHDLPPGPLALVVENIFRNRSLEQEIGLYYRITWPSTLAPDDLEAGIESGHRFRWVPVRDLGSLDFRPAGLIPILPELTGTLQHVVLDGLDRITPVEP